MADEPQVDPFTPRLGEAAAAGGGAVAGAASTAGAHEFSAEERNGHHRVVATAMIIVFLVTAISQGWWKHLRDFMNEKTHGPSKEAKPGG